MHFIVTDRKEEGNYQSGPLVVLTLRGSPKTPLVDGRLGKLGNTAKNLLKNAIQDPAGTQAPCAALCFRRNCFDLVLRRTGTLSGEFFGNEHCQTGFLPLKVEMLVCWSTVRSGRREKAMGTIRRVGGPFLLTVGCLAVLAIALGDDREARPQSGDQQAKIVMADKDWPVFRGNSLQTGVARQPLPDKLQILWQFKTQDAIEGSAVIADGVVYVGSYDQNLYAIDLQTGNLKWKYQAGPIKAAPGVYKGLVFVGDMDGGFHCLDARTGKKKWTFKTGGEITAGPNFVDDAVLVGCYADETLYKLSLDGKVLWKFKTEGPVNGSPAVVGKQTFVAGCDSVLRILDIEKGKEQAKVDLDGPAGASAAIAGQHLYVGTMNNEFLAVDWKNAKIEWRYRAARNAREFYASAALSEDLVVVGCRDKRVHAIDRKTGKPVWNFQTKGRVDSSPVLAGGRIYVGSLDGHLYVLDLRKGNLIAQFKLGDAISASPAVAAGRLVIGTEDGVVFCLGAKN
ncbi:MAG: hypothetical protein KatS3mg105_0554 [Gemmatales bacterium]|nr:MAG: hypothetical protein KatS3mg105_0554 [Gemmatales bacterium]